MRELSLHILDIIQNSIAAGSTRIVVGVEADETQNILAIRIADNGKGMDPEFASKIRDPFVTTRTVRKVGLGIPMFAAAAEACDGGLVIDSQVGKGTTVTATFQLNHIDRMPMGDIASTITSAIAANGDISIRYEHTVNNEQFVLDTDDIKTQLEDVPINSPAVVTWLRDYLAEGISATGVIA